MFLGASYGEISLFVLVFLALIATWVHFLRWQRRVMLMLHAIQTQVQDATFSHQRLHDDMIKKITEEVGEQAQTLAQFFQPSNFGVGKDGGGPATWTPGKPPQSGDDGVYLDDDSGEFGRSQYRLTW